MRVQISVHITPYIAAKAIAKQTGFSLSHVMAELFVLGLSEHNKRISAGLSTTLSINNEIPAKTETAVVNNRVSNTPEKTAEEEDFDSYLKNEFGRSN